ncbi:hypothetical protein ACIBCR_14975 [Micromonospora echinospora]|uniref:hypothetical protein n=1 Tax=Micromonospora echinospora TaxID=1877 RepID=UPI003799F343
MARHIVATILPGRTLDAALSAMRGMSRCYPDYTLSLASDPDGGMAIIHDPAATPPAKGRKRRRKQTTGDAGEIALGKDEAGDLLAYAFHPTTSTEDGVKAITQWMVDLLAQTEGAANYVTFTLTHPSGNRYALTVQRCDGMTPAEKIAHLEEQIAALTNQEEHVDGRGEAANRVLNQHRKETP